MEGIGKELVRWLIGGGALALLTFGGTTYYQQVQLELQEQEQRVQQELSRQQFLREFLSNHVEIATKGTLEERLRFASYFTALGADNLGVNFDNYKETLIAEAEAARAEAAPAPEDTDSGSGGEGGSGGDTDGSGGTTSPANPPPAAAARPTAAKTYLVEGLSKTVVARQAEREGFSAVLANDFKTAHDQFAKAAKAWPTYHNVSEMQALTRRILGTHSSGEMPDDALRQTLREILTKYSWGMPEDLKASMQGLAKG